MGLKILVSLVRFPVAPLRRKAKDSKILISKRNRDFLFSPGTQKTAKYYRSRWSKNLHRIRVFLTDSITFYVYLI